MIVYTTCAVCHETMEVVQTYEVAHPNCAHPATLAEQYRAAIVAGDEAEEARLAGILDAPAKAPQLLKAALTYASWGWPVFPLKVADKRPATRNGFKDATTDPDRIRAYWTRRPLANIGLPTGVKFDVIDLDAPKCWPSFKQMDESDAIPPVHAQVQTPGGGRHLYVRPSGEGNRAGILPGVDVRGVGGYVVAPPSQDARGRYTFLHKPSPVIRRASTRERKAA